MRDYEELVRQLRKEADKWCTNCCYRAEVFTCVAPDDRKKDCDEYTKLQAADAIEELRKPDWNKVESRPMTEEERKEWSEHIAFDIEDEDAIIYTSKLPDDGQEVLVCNKWGRVWIDTFSDDPDYGVGFEENGDMDGIVAWMPKPKPYEPPKEDENGRHFD